MMTLIIICIGDEYSLTDHNVNLSVHQIIYIFFSFSLVTIAIVNILSIYNLGINQVMSITEI